MSVSTARLEVTCPWHRFRFDLRTGRNVLSDIREGAKVYPVEINKNGDVLVTIGD
jgi:nitrite reductase/ring-hydroxylating ferredoxin subunit